MPQLAHLMHIRAYTFIYSLICPYLTLKVVFWSFLGRLQDLWLEPQDSSHNAATIKMPWLVPIWVTRVPTASTRVMGFKSLSLFLGWLSRGPRVIQSDSRGQKSGESSRPNQGVIQGVETGLAKPAKPANSPLFLCDETDILKWIVNLLSICEGYLHVWKIK